MGLAAVELHTAQEVISHARAVQARIRASYGPSVAIQSLRSEIDGLRFEIHNTKAERDMYRALVDELRATVDELKAQRGQEQPAIQSVALKVKSILDLVCRSYSEDPRDVISEQRNTHLTEPRHVALYLCRRLTKLSWSRIAKHFGGRDHSTCAHAVTKIELRMKADPDFAARINNLEQRLSVS